jgi:hypothetical protein
MMAVTVGTHVQGWQALQPRDNSIEGLLRVFLNDPISLPHLTVQEVASEWHDAVHSQRINRLTDLDPPTAQTQSSGHYEEQAKERKGTGSPKPQTGCKQSAIEDENTLNTIESARRRMQMLADTASEVSELRHPPPNLEDKWYQNPRAHQEAPRE